jgi:hypothetical protein
MCRGRLAHRLARVSRVDDDDLARPAISARFGRLVMAGSAAPEQRHERE